MKSQVIPMLIMDQRVAMGRIYKKEFKKIDECLFTLDKTLPSNLFWKIQEEFAQRSKIVLTLP